MVRDSLKIIETASQTEDIIEKCKVILVFI